MGVRVCRAAAAVAVVLATWVAPAAAQGTGPAPSVQGTVTAAGGAVVPGAEVLAVQTGATTTRRAVLTNSRGGFAIPTLPAGTYTVTVRAVGFHNAVRANVEVGATSLPPLDFVLERAPFQAPAVETTLDATWVDRLPLLTHRALDAVTFLPGVDTADINRRSTILGLPSSAIAITLDGVNVQDNFLKSRDGFFTFVPARVDAVDGATLVLATSGSEAGGEGAVRVQFVTRAGTATPRGTAYYTGRFPGLASEADAGFPSATRVSLNQFGISQGGPLRAGSAPRAFYFFNYEELHAETDLTRARTLLSPDAQAGVFRYGGGAIDLLALAGSQGHLSSADPTIAGILAQMRAAAGAISGTADPNLQQAIVQNEASRTERQPTIRVDYQTGPRHRLSASFTTARVAIDPDILNAGDPAFPGFANQRAQESTQSLAQLTWRRGIKANWLNELRIGGAWGPITFGPDLAASQFQNAGGFNLAFPLITPPAVANTFTRRDVSTFTIDDALTMPFGRHEVSVGGTLTRVTGRVRSQTIAPTLRFGVEETDPAAALFTTAVFPGASTAELDQARALYALLTGRVTAIDADLGLDEGANRYGFLGPVVEEGRLNQYGLFVQDTWRPSPVVTISAGLRWELQPAFVPLNNAWAAPTLVDACGISGPGNGPFGRGCILFQPGVEIGDPQPKFVAFPRGSEAYRMEKDNFAPRLGFAWRPRADAGVLRRIFGDPEIATIHAGYAVAFERLGLADFFDVLSPNPGARLAHNRTTAGGNLIVDGGSLPLLLRDPARLAPLPVCPAGTITPTCQQVAPVFPRPAVAGDTLSIFDPRISRPFTQSLSGGLQRSLGPATTVHVRYIGARYEDGWLTENFNEAALFESGFLDEFRLAQGNLLANLAQGRGATFAFFGPDTGTSPLPLYLGFFGGVPSADATDPARYTPAFFTNSTFIAPLSTHVPDPLGALNTLLASAERRANILASGRTSNLFLMNPAIGDGLVSITRNAASAHTDAIHVELHRRLSRGLALSASYAYTRAWRTTVDSVRFEPYFVRNIESVPHAVKVLWAWDVPLGRGRAAGAAMSRALDAIVGGWQVTGLARIQSGRQVAASRIRLVGMSEDELRREFRPRVDAATGLVTMLPDDIILNTRRAFSVDPTSPTGYSALGAPEGRFISPASGPGCTNIFPGDCGEPRQVEFRGPLVSRVDVSFRKSFAIGGTRAFEVHVDVFDLLNADDFIPVFNPGSSANIFQVTRSLQDAANTFDPGGRLAQIGIRFRW